ncbi:glutathione S-transferase family protein [Brumicola nitratireducens]|uniref:Glutathione S-transferase-like protein n=1 Tax=Glaciecola nitratireducens (strain JCM 12485 / KCTC 12276 / FR1064) TaxID=1085623 RepID=G4QF58_GLANF|nr:glutathione S-transferase [Glaciecola nitratireducens]AEP28402.1 glutathione S-transferase-like protein [Glaciecola nitratireducens FR1064]
MLKLYGFDVSNYYNMIKLAMAIKGIEYEAVITYPNQTPEYLAICPTGKVPALATDDGVLIETNVILEYLDEVSPETPLISGSAYERARIRELMKMIELYIELPARRCHTEAFWGVPVHEETKKEVKRALLNGMQALSRAASFSPYIAGDKMTAADIFFMYSVSLASAVAKKLFGIDLFAEAPGAKELFAKLNAMPEARAIAKDQAAAQPAFQAYLAKAFAKKP